MTLEEKIKRVWNKDIYITEKSDYRIYPVKNMNVILTTDEKVLRQYKHIERKGSVENINDDYELGILQKVNKEYNIELHPNLYYVMWSN